MPSISLLAAGSNARGQLATGDTEDAHQFCPCIFIGNSAGVLPNRIAAVEQIACGSNHTLALLRTDDGKTELWGCGDGSKGQLGPSYVAHTHKASDDARAVFRPLDLSSEVAGVGPLDGFTVRLIAAGWETSYVALSHSDRGDVLLSMGANDFGNLGVGACTSARSNQSVHVVDLSSVLPFDEVRPGAILKILSLSAGPHHTIVRVSFAFPDGSSRTFLAGWGTSRHGQLGPILNEANRSNLSTSSPHPIPADDPDDIMAISLGNQHTVCLRSSGHLHALGSNRKEQLSGIEALGGMKQIDCTWNGTYALLDTGEVVATGSNTHCQLGRGAGTHERHGGLAPVQFPFVLSPGQVSYLICGSEHVLCIIDRSDSSESDAHITREVWGWGWNEHGNLGTRGTDDVGVPVKIWPPPPSVVPAGESAGDVVHAWAGCGTSFLLVHRH
ncbi:RCC1/BLIP-II [Lentinus tigrinus ALCF2SS1-7]|uniref:RCC1/BLIP-II n=1 Tax=Lentinus tigrinus ALCF2SS1-7 TaxID=1328758 RepID=UPI0011661181|nr:RCC1/BLIP-II [Lentinus tigrinus ALCF2SS1-7]